MGGGKGSSSTQVQLTPEQQQTLQIQNDALRRLAANPGYTAKCLCIACYNCDGDIVHSALMLKEEDLRFINLDATRRALDNFVPPSSVAMDNIRIDRALSTRPTVR